MMGHMFCMFAPSPLTGKLVRRFGSLKAGSTNSGDETSPSFTCFLWLFVWAVSTWFRQVINAGLVLACATAIILWLESELWAFVVAMALLGFTWNFMFLGGGRDGEN